MVLKYLEVLHTEFMLLTRAAERIEECERSNKIKVYPLQIALEVYRNGKGRSPPSLGLALSRYFEVLDAAKCADVVLCVVGPHASLEDRILSPCGGMLNWPNDMNMFVCKTIVVLCDAAVVLPSSAGKEICDSERAFDSQGAGLRRPWI